MFYWGTNGNDNYAGTNDADVMLGFGGDDRLNGEGGNDRLFGNKGNDFLNGGDGDDNLNGGNGDDILNGSQGNDTADYSDSTKGISVDLGTLIDGDYAKAEDGYGTVDKLFYIENIVGSKVGNDYIRGDSQANILSGLGGDDTLLGFGGNDTLNGGNGDDLIDGGTAIGVNSTMDMTRFNTLTGGNGADTFILRDLTDTGMAHNIITDFNAAEGDKIEIISSEGSYVQALTSGSDTILFSGYVFAGIYDSRIATLKGVTNFDVENDLIISEP
ncbi:calcium-binding protein [Dapis sp. BLCC M229]|uniref:calcium-binding protein n=1 Tax=Dapis sp. BLCC M229 TaxID=3400188 RepID=UPI003CE93BFC